TRVWARPPSSGVASKSTGDRPRRAKVAAATNPAMPPPTTATRASCITSPVSDNLCPFNSDDNCPQMKTLEGVEWAAHACAVLAGLAPGSSLNATALADFHKLPSAYMAKHLQALVRGGVLAASRGGRGGYRLARPRSE